MQHQLTVEAVAAAVPDGFRVFGDVFPGSSMMSESAERQPVARRRVVYDPPDTGAVLVSADVVFHGADGRELAMDLYHPPATAADARLPLVVIVSGYPDEGYRRVMGCPFKDVGWCVSWARLLAVSGVAAVASTNRAPGPDLVALLRCLRERADSLRVDPRRLGVLACSGNAPLALSLLMRDAPYPASCAALCYGYTLDIDGATAVADAARRFGFDNPCAGRSVDDLVPDRPLFVVRAGADVMPGLNEALDTFTSHAVARNLPLTLVNHPAGPHAFDLFDDSDESRAIIRQAMEFLARHVGREPRRDVAV